MELVVTAGLHRRQFVAAGGAGLLVASRARAVGVDEAARTLAAIEADIGGRLGVAALDTGSGVWLRHRADERFAMASTFKVLLVATVLRRVDQGELKLDQRVPFSRADLLEYAPRARAHVDRGAMSVLDLCAAAVEVSDNTAGNLLLALVGGPPGFTAGLRRLGDPTTRLDRTEPALNTNLPDDVRDTSSPAAFVLTLRRVLLADRLSTESRRQLTAWMVNCQTGLARLRAGLPVGWKVGDKTGTGENGAVNDVAIVWPPGRPPILIAALLSGSKRPTEALAAAQARIGRVVVGAFG